MNKWLEKIKNLKKANEDLLAKAKAEDRAFNADEQKTFSTNQEEIKNAVVMFDAEKATDDLEKQFSTPVNSPMVSNVQVKPGQEPSFFNSLSEQLRSVKNHATTGSIDEKLLKVNNQLGMNEGKGSDGGFAVQSDFAGLMMDSAVKESGLLSLLDTYNVSAGKNAATWVDIDEDNIENTVFGGVQVYFANEGTAVTASRPKLKERELKLEKLMGIAYSTYELEEDSNFIDQLYTRSFSLAIRRKLEGMVISGAGGGVPLGILNGNSTVSIPAEGGQAVDTVIWENLSKMYHRNIDKSSAVWVMHPDVHEQLDFLNFPVGVGGVPVYLPATQTGSIASLRGRPILESDHCSELGDVGDIMFLDPKAYMMIYKGGVKKDVSISVAFLTAENCFRFIFRANGMPKWSKDLKIKNSAKRRSPYITLATR